MPMFTRSLLSFGGQMLPRSSTCAFFVSPEGCPDDENVAEVVEGVAVVVVVVAPVVYTDPLSHPD
eukprot:8526556-Pyramimonas_sp.AAC.1